MKAYCAGDRVVLLALSAAMLASGCALFGGGTRERKILSGLNSNDPARRQRALVGLRGETTPAVRNRVGEILIADPDASARALAASAAGRLGMAEAAKELIRALRQDRDWIVRQRAARALVSIQRAGAAQHLEFLLRQDPHPAVRAEAVRMAATALERKRAVTMILEGLKDDSVAVQLAAYGRLKALTGLDVPPDDYDRWKKQIAEGGLPEPGAGAGTEESLDSQRP